ncbi:tryptophan synthase subunit beta [Patescibacteria group bacterium]|nr:tryptophan synthase subunit beta [Patescibacteria group bacterium]
MKLFFQTKYDADKDGHFGDFGGRYMPEVLVPALEELTRAYEEIKRDKVFERELFKLYKDYLGRPTPLYLAENLTRHLGGAKIYLKNEGLLHTGAHKMNNSIAQALLAKKMGKRRLIAETGAGQHGLAVATVAAKFGFACTIYMGAKDVARQQPNVFFMKQLGAEVVAVEEGTKTLKDAVNMAIKDWLADPDDSYFLLGSTVGPHPYPSLVRDFQSIIGLEVKEQLTKRPDYLVACVGGGSNAIGLFNAFLDDQAVKMIGVEAGGQGVAKIGQHASRLTGRGRLGVVEGFKSYFLQDKEGNIQPTASISAGLDYAGIGPEHGSLYESKRVQYTQATDQEALRAYQLLAQKEGILAALESAHAVAAVIKLAPKLAKSKTIVVNISGRGDKDLFITADKLDRKNWRRYLKNQAENNG